MNSLNIETKLLECPICFNIEPGPKYNCQSGHTICSKCRFQVEVCALCNAPFTSSRNYTLESLIDSLKIGPLGSSANDVVKYCPFKSDGCMEQSDSAMFIYDHAQFCDYRTINCGLDYNAACYRQDVSYSGFFTHLKQDHQIVGVDNYSGPFTKTDFCDKINEDIKWKPFYIMYDGNIFFRRCQLIDGVIYWWFSILGSKKLATNYKACIRSSLGGNHHSTAVVPSFKFCLPVLSFRMEAKRVLVSGHYASMTLYQLQNFCKSSTSIKSPDVGNHAYIWETNISILKND